MEYQMIEINFDFSRMGEMRTPSQQFSLSSFRSPTSIPASAHAKEIRKIISFIGYSLARFLLAVLG